MHLSEGNKFLLSAKKRAANKTSNYLISTDPDNMNKNANSYMGKLRSNFLGTEFYIYNDGANPKKAVAENETREQHGCIQYETNVLGSKGPRRMKVLLPYVNESEEQFKFPAQNEQEMISEKFKSGMGDNLMFFFNKPPKWNECKFSSFFSKYHLQLCKLSCSTSTDALIRHR